MGSVWFIARAQARRRWRALVALTLFIGLVGGLSLSLIAGSRRSSTVVNRFYAAARPYDLQLFVPSLTRDQVLAIPGVTRADSTAYLGVVASKPNGEPGDEGDGINGNAINWDALDPTFRILEGAVPDGSDPSEVLVNEFFVEQFGRSVGDSVNVQAFAREQAEEVSRGVYEAHGPKYRFQITGVVRTPFDIAVDEIRSVGRSSSGSSNGMAVSHEFYEAHRDEFLDFGEGLSVKLQDGRSGREQFVAAVNALVPAGEDPASVGPASTVRRDALESPVDLETSALLALGIGLAIAGAIAAGLVLRAEQRAIDDDTPTLRTLGSTVPQLGLAAVLRTLPVAIGGMLLAIGIALALSARYPIGIGRELELQGGADANFAVLGLGALAILVFTVGLSFLLGLPRRVRGALPSRRLTFARWLSQVGAPTDLALGAQLAFERGRGVRSVPARQAIIGGAAALALVTSLAIYVAGVDHLYAVPKAHGWSWDAAIGNTNFPLSKSTAGKLARDGRIRHRTAVGYGDATVNGRATEFLAFNSDGDAPPAIIAGRLPETESEVALGRGVVDALGIDIGSTVTFSVADGEFDGGGRTPSRQMRVVGEALSPIFGEADVGEVGIVTLDGLESAGGDPAARFVLVRLRDGARPADLLSLRRDYTEEILTDAVPARIVNLHRVRRLPLLGLVLAGFMGTTVLVYTLAISARARSRELAVLRALGLPSRRLRGVLAWQGTVLGAGMLVIGVPLGLVLGSAVWNTVADDLGVADTAVFSPLLLLLVPLALVVAVGASLYPSRRARRAPVAAVLRVE